MSPWASERYDAGAWTGGAWRSRRAFTPRFLFQGGEQGAWYDPSDISTLFQDSAGTTPVTADGEPVGLMLDKSGGGNHASQSTATAKPIYRTDGALSWLEFDGVNDHLEFFIPFSLFSSGLSYYLGYDTQSEARGVFYSKFNASAPWAFIFQDGSGVAALTDVADAGEPTLSLSVDGLLADASNRDKAHTAVTGSHVLGWDASGATGGYSDSTGHGIGNYNAGGIALSGKLSGLIWREALTQPEKDSVNGYLAKKAGVQL